MSDRNSSPVQDVRQDESLAPPLRFTIKWRLVPRLPGQPRNRDQLPTYVPSIVYADRPPVDGPPGFGWVRARGGWCLGREIAPQNNRGRGRGRGEQRQGGQRGITHRGGRGGRGEGGLRGRIMANFHPNSRTTDNAEDNTESDTSDSDSSSSSSTLTASGAGVDGSNA